jgi:hypothetical protein
VAIFSNHDAIDGKIEDVEVRKSPRVARPAYVLFNGQFR